MSFWERGDLILSLNGPSDGVSRAPVYAAFSIPDGTLRDMMAIPLPPTTNSASPIGLTVQPDNTLIWARTANNTGSAIWNNKVVYSSGNGDLTIDRPAGNDIGSMAFDAAGNRYMGDVDPDTGFYVVRKVNAASSAEEISLIHDAYINDGTVDGIGVPPNRIFVTPDGSKAYWHAEALNPFNPSTFTGFNRMRLDTNEMLRRFDFKDYFPTTVEYADMARGPVTGYIYVFFGRTNLPWIGVVDPETDEIVNQFPVGNSDCATGMAAMNCDETIIAFVHSDVGFTNIELWDPIAGTFLRSVDYEGQTGKSVFRGMTFVPCPVIDGGFMPFVTLVGAT